MFDAYSRWCPNVTRVRHVDTTADDLANTQCVLASHGFELYPLTSSSLCLRVCCEPEFAAVTNMEYYIDTIRHQVCFTVVGLESFVVSLWSTSALGATFMTAIATDQMVEPKHYVRPNMFNDLSESGTVPAFGDYDADGTEIKARYRYMNIITGMLAAPQRHPRPMHVVFSFYPFIGGRRGILAIGAGEEIGPSFAPPGMHSNAIGACIWQLLAVIAGADWQKYLHPPSYVCDEPMMIMDNSPSPDERAFSYSQFLLVKVSFYCPRRTPVYIDSIKPEAFKVVRVCDMKCPLKDDWKRAEFMANQLRKDYHKTPADQPQDEGQTSSSPPPPPPPSTPAQAD